MGKASRTKQDGGLGRRDKVEALRLAEVKAQRRRNLLWALVGLILVGLIAGLTYWGLRPKVTPPTAEEASRSALEAQVTTYPVADSPKHTPDAVTYAQTPPVGGDHDAAWLNCGIYDKPVRNENAVHSLEHGAVWVTYDPALSTADVAALRAQMPSTYIVLSPYERLTAPVVASAWGVQLSLTGVDDPRLKTFIDVYRQGTQTPEPGAACDGGIGTPITG